ncbi:diaminopimelate decarboxylase [Sulfuricaulis limicola]|uniref:Diaminopimelate decarboxylase n=1 Tax=Sulfuricaulis limicola TaxID=1620215 RepID=A0A1B4XDU8_9GAMM|nr:diaminopimelate decarboxylase [Sulfuricaulis limicola]BAV32985.1 diaminopimelate decarboxylase [Sulfuricaulis limicola]
MNSFSYRDRQLYAENVRLADIAQQLGTPCYVYSRAALEDRFQAFADALKGRDHLVCYAVKANSNLAVLNLLARLGSGFDIVSGGELERVLAAGGDPAKVVFSGVGKTRDEMHRALAAGIYCFNVESEAELEVLNEIAGELGKPAPVALRVNPDVDPATHPYIATGLKQSKFGIDIAQAMTAFERARSLPHLRVTGIACHIGSQLTDLAPVVEALDRVLGLANTLLDKGFTLQHLDLGGGLGIRYNEEQPPSPDAYIRAILDRLASKGGHGRKLRLVFEPGRAIVGNTGLLLTRVLYLKHGSEKNFAVVDAAMNDLLRPALYEAWHDITPVAVDAPRKMLKYDVVGPVCESGDFLGHDRELGIEAGDLLAVVSAGAYGAVMSSNYNTRPRAPEVMVDGDRFQVVRRRETVAELFASESILPK